MVYGDRPSYQYWQSFVAAGPHGAAEINGDERLKGYYLKYLSPSGPGASMEEREACMRAITSFGIRDWSREPFGGGAHFWKPGVPVIEGIEALAGFPLKGAHHPRKSLHICGEAFSDFQGFIEGALRTASGVTARIGRYRHSG